MGDLTDHRKRCLLDHHHCLDDPPIPPLKKLKLFSSSHPASQTMAPPSLPFPPLRRFPPAAPLPRPVHGLQRILKAFGLGSSTRSPLPLDPPTDEMRNLVLHRSKKPPLRLEEPTSSSPVPSQRPTEAPPAEELTVVESEEPSDLYILDRKVEESGKVVLECMPVREEQRLPTRRYGSPLYKELYEAPSRKFESILSGLAFEVKLAEEKRSSFRAIRETLAKEVKEDQHEPFTQLTDEEEHVVNHALQGGRRHEVLVIHEASNIEITREILRCLKYGAWLNDEEPTSSSPVPSQRPTEAPPAEELTVVESGEPSDLYILDRKVEESGKIVLESTPVREEQRLPTRRYGSPLYKELYEAPSRKFESILSGLAFEVKLAEEKRSSFSAIRETLAKEVKEVEESGKVADEEVW